MMTTLSNDELLKLHGTKIFLRDFYQINGFEFDSIDYSKDVDLKTLAKQLPK